MSNFQHFDMSHDHIYIFLQFVLFLTKRDH